MSASSAVDHPLVRLGIAGALRADLRLFDLAQVVTRQLEIGRGDVLFEAVELRRPRDRDERRALREDPCEGNLRCGRASPLRDSLHEIDERTVRLACLGREARDGVAEVAGLERRALVDRSREKALAKRAERDEADSELLQGRDDLVLRLPPP